MGRYRYFNDNNYLLRIGPDDASEQFIPESVSWSPGGAPSYRAAWLDRKSAGELAYRLVMSFGDKGKLSSLDIGPEEYNDKDYRFYLDRESGVMRRVGMGMKTEEFVPSSSTWRRCHHPTYRSLRLSYQEAKKQAGDDIGPEHQTWEEKIKSKIAELASGPFVALRESEESSKSSGAMASEERE